MRRMMLGLSQEKLAEPLGLTFQQVQKYEKGTNRIGSSRLVQIAGILQVPVAWFFEGTGQGEPAIAAPPRSFVDEFIASPDGIAIARSFTAIGDRKLRSRIVDLIEQIAASEVPDRKAAA
jgi:transcriptional regulator with XRE-family HTH domain